MAERHYIPENNPAVLAEVNTIIFNAIKAGERHLTIYMLLSYPKWQHLRHVMPEHAECEKFSELVHLNAAIYGFQVLTLESYPAQYKLVNSNFLQ